MQNLKSIGRELIEILSFINTVTLVQFWVTLFFSGTKAKSRTLPSYARAVLKTRDTQQLMEKNVDTESSCFFSIFQLVMSH